MKKYLPLIVSLTVIFAISTSIQGQTRVTGHIFAEIVETVSVNSAMNNSFQLKRDNNESNIDLGTVSVNGSAYTTRSIIVSPATITGPSGTSLEFQTNSSDQFSNQQHSETGRDELSLSATINETLLLMEDNNYSGQYDVVLVYN